MRCNLFYLQSKDSADGEGNERIPEFFVAQNIGGKWSFPVFELVDSVVPEPVECARPFPLVGTIRAGVATLPAVLRDGTLGGFFESIGSIHSFVRVTNFCPHTDAAIRTTQIPRIVSHLGGSVHVAAAGLGVRNAPPPHRAVSERATAWDFGLLHIAVVRGRGSVFSRSQ